MQARADVPDRFEAPLAIGLSRVLARKRRRPVELVLHQRECQPALADIGFVLGWIEADLSRFYCIHNNWRAQSPVHPFGAYAANALIRERVDEVIE